MKTSDLADDDFLRALYDNGPHAMDLLMASWPKNLVMQKHRKHLKRGWVTVDWHLTPEGVEKLRG